MLAIAGQIARTLLESSDARAGQVEGAPSPPFLQGHEIEAAPDDLGLGMSSLCLQLLEDGSLRGAKAGMDIGFHSGQCSTK